MSATHAPTLVVGGGSWGTTLAIHLGRQGRPAVLWARDGEQRQRLSSARENKKYLPGFRFPDLIHVALESSPAPSGWGHVIWAVPSHGLRELLRELKVTAPSATLAAKGIEEGTGATMSELYRSVMGAESPLVVLGGPSLAREIAEERPAAVVVASTDAEAAGAAQSLLASDLVRVYTSCDVMGVELGGALKNVIALAAGIADGLGLGHNARGALLTRGLAEILRLGVELGARSDTFLGLAGMGDLVTTCTSALSRNHEVGVALGRGDRLADILARTPMVAEGVRTARAARELSRRHGVELPIVEQVARILFEDRRPEVALRELMLRPLRAE